MYEAYYFLSPFRIDDPGPGLSFSLLTPEYLRASGFRATYSGLLGARGCCLTGMVHRLCGCVQSESLLSSDLQYVK